MCRYIFEKAMKREPWGLCSDRAGAGKMNHYSSNSVKQVFMEKS